MPGEGKSKGEGEGNFAVHIIPREFLILLPGPSTSQLFILLLLHLFSGAPPLMNVGRHKNGKCGNMILRAMLLLCIVGGMLKVQDLSSATLQLSAPKANTCMTASNSEAQSGDGHEALSARLLLAFFLSSYLCTGSADKAID